MLLVLDKISDVIYPVPAKITLSPFDMRDEELEFGDEIEVTKCYDLNESSSSSTCRHVWIEKLLSGRFSIVLKN